MPASFWAKVLPVVRDAHPDAWFLGEMIRGDYAAYAADSGLDSITQYELWKAIWSSLNDPNFFELAWALGGGGEESLVQAFALRRLRPEQLPGWAFCCCWRCSCRALAAPSTARAAGSASVPPSYPRSPRARVESSRRIAG